MLIEEEGTIYPVEIKLTMRPDKGMLKGMNSHRKSGIKNGRGAIFCLTENRYPLTAEVAALPVAYV